MAGSERGLTSNLIIKGSAPPPKIKNLAQINTRLQSILDLQEKINAQKTTIHVDLTGSTKAISSLKDIIRISGKAFKAIPRDKRIVAAPPTSPPFRPTQPPPVTGTSLSETRSRKQTKKGVSESVVTQDVTFQGSEERLRTITQTDSSTEDKIKKTNLQVEGDRKRQRRAANLRADQEVRFAEAEMEYAIRAKNRAKFEERAKAQGFQQRGLTEVKNIQPIKGLDRQVQVRSVEYFKKQADGSEIVARFDEERDQRAKKRVSLQTQEYKNNETERKKQERFQIEQAAFDKNKAKNQKDIARAQRAGFSVAATTPVSISPVKGLAAELQGTITRLQRQVSSGNKSGAIEYIDISDAEKTTGPRKIRTNKDTPEFRANRAAEDRARKSLAAQKREAEVGNRALALFNRTSTEFAALEKNLKSMGYQVRDVGSGVREIAPGLKQMVTQAEFFRMTATGHEEVISARSDRAGYKNLPLRETQASKDLNVTKEFLRTSQAAATLNTRLTAAGYSAQVVATDFKEIGGAVMRVNTTEYRRRKAGGTGEEEVFRVTDDSAKAKRRIDRNTPEFKESARNQKIGNNAAAQQAIAATPRTELRQARGDILLYATAQQDGTEVMTRFNRITGEQQTYLNKNTKAANEYRRATQILSNEIAYQNREVQLLSQGYTRASQKANTFELAGQQITSRMTEMRRVSGNALFGNLQLEIERMDSSTGKMTRQVLTGRDAMRQMGDSFSNATAKVGLWLAATQGLFMGIAAIQRAWQETKQLESGTILLARVSRGLGNGFKEQLEGARQLTTEIINLSTQTGISAVEAQKAATIFGRAGQNRLQIIESVRVALLASKIAELDVVEAANLIASAQAQFNLRAEDSIDILNTVNNLSNNYRVTTNDLLQSISRAGSVYAEHNGTLEQLAATTALISATTNRSGAEIGNALKTIQSRLTAPEVAGTLLETAGISTRTLAGETKNLTKILLQLKIVESQLNEEEAQQLNVRIAGARQVNILQSALNTVTQTIVAEANALRDNNSAKDEASQQNKSLQSSLDRMSQLFTKIVSSGTTFNSVVTQIINTINQVLRLITAFDGLGIKVGLAVAAFTLIRLAVVRFNLQALAGGQVLNSFAAGLANMGRQGAAAAGSMLSLSSIFSRTNLIAIGLTAVIWGLTYALSENEQATADAATAEKAHADELARTTTLAQRKARAAKEVSDALEEWLQALEDLDKQEAEGKPVNEETRRFYANQIKLITGKTGKFDRNGQGIDPLKDGKADPKAIQKIRERAAEIRKAESDELTKTLQAQVENEKKTRSLAGIRIEQEREKEEKRKEKQREGGDPYAGRLPDQSIDDLIKEKSRLIDLIERSSNPKRFQRTLDLVNEEIALRLDSEKKVSEIENSIEESKLKQFELEQQIANEKKKGLKAGATITNEDLRGAVKQADEVDARMDQFKKLDDANFRVSTGNPGEEQILIQEKLIHLAETLRIAKLSLEKLGQSEEHSDKFQKEAENARNAIEQVRKYQQTLKELRIEQARSFVEDRIKNSKGIAEEFAITQTKLRQLRAGVDPTIVDDDEINRIKVKKEQAAAFLSRGQAAGANPLLSAEERIGVITASNKAAADSLTEAKDLEIDQAKKLLNLEVEILKQRKEQTKEALKALGALSDEDKLRVLAIAKDIRARKGKNITGEEQFFNDENTNKLLQQFFGGNIDVINPKEGRLGNAFRGIDLQQFDPDLKKKEDLLKQKVQDNNAFDAQGVVGQANDRIEKLQQQIDKLNGKDQVNKNGALGNQQQQGVKNDIRNFGQNPFENMNVNVDMMPLVDAFRNVTLIQVKTLRDEMVKELGKIGEEILRMKGVRGALPRVDG